jgi:glycolate oxidase iron-sulfur subunit
VPSLSIDPTELSTCVGCGLCLPHCPTFRVTGEEGLSPRGRIAAMRAVQDDDAPVDGDFIRFIDTCVQCRGCEPACPSGVPYGHLVEAATATLAASKRITPWWQRLGLRALAKHRLLLVGSTVLAAAQRVRLVPRRFGLSRLPLRRGALPAPTGTDVWLFTGCVMDAWMRGTHRSTAALITATGATFALPGSGAACCGALHVHAGLEDDARRRAEATMAAMPGHAPILVNSAGCGAALKEYGHLLGTPEAAAFSARVLDVHEWLAPRLGQLPRPGRRLDPVIIQDPCHLRHVQRAHLPVRDVVGVVADVIELDDDGVCCGAGGAYSAMHPAMAAEIRERKLAAIRRAAPAGTTVVSANPGCAMHLAAAGVTVCHPLDVVASAIIAS